MQDWLHNGLPGLLEEVSPATLPAGWERPDCEFCKNPMLLSWRKNAPPSSPPGVCPFCCCREAGVPV